MSNSKRTKAKFIDDVQVTNDCLTSRAGLNLFARYVRRIGLSHHINHLFGSMRKNPNGTPIDEIQFLRFLFDGTSRHLVHFDVLAKDPGYAAVIETDIKGTASSHTIKRFFQVFSAQRAYLFRRLLQHLFVWRLSMSRPKVVELISTPWSWKRPSP